MSLEARLDALAALSLGELRDQWRSSMGSEPPRVSADLLRRLLGYALQEKTMGGLSPSHGQALRRLAAGKESVLLKSGMHLMRQWNGRSISVTVVEDGYVWEERCYRSLSAIARAVTGTSWSGPRFFGLHDHG
ncbi:DUF2924 domain-containing protein [Sphingobium sp. B11D3D]|uniref:DUF2924 domain-containing protein n=1 Tax=Sphingobium sp. B11D3D TaxID=2940576 RepID=UPI00222430D2|nr:DUF2924 domain-containing protein [Sphingobium sp. B11D3D]MCW2370743.1 hypothetical protein [Sphingobium sp. B11D3D]